MGHVVVRRAQRDEADAVAELWLRSRRTAQIPATVHTDKEVRAWVGGELMSSCELWVASDDDQIVAMIALGNTSVEQLYVSPEHQRHGHGTRLLELAQARRDELTLWAFASNGAARRFYEAHGFIRSGPDSDANEERAPAIPYRWQRAGEA